VQQEPLGDERFEAGVDLHRAGTRPPAAGGRVERVAVAIIGTMEVTIEEGTASRGLFRRRLGQIVCHVWMHPRPFLMSVLALLFAFRYGGRDGRPPIHVWTITTSRQPGRFRISPDAVRVFDPVTGEAIR
jgi:hypothetical protein